MKYIIMCLAALIVCFCCAWFPTNLIRKKKHLQWPWVALLMLVFSLAIAGIVMMSYLGVYYHAEPEALEPSPSVKVEKIDGGYFFNGPGNEEALIFYPGAKVEATAYAPLMTALAENGMDCFLAEMPFRMAIFGSNTAEKFLNTYSYSRWTAAGHSMGGLVISGFASDHADMIDNLVLLAAYPGTEIPESISFCSIYGTLDGCLNMQAYEQAKVYWPDSSSEVVLEGGNHAQYADYGEQSGDKEPSISRNMQQEQTVAAILEAVR